MLNYIAIKHIKSQVLICFGQLINVCLFPCVFCVFVTIYIHVVALSWFCAVRVAVCCVCCVSWMNSFISLIKTCEIASMRLDVVKLTEQLGHV